MSLKRLFLPTLPSLLVERKEPFIHRDLSWLQFNERVLSEARDKSNPLLERLKFLSITASNLNEFFMIRFGSLERTIPQHIPPAEKEGRLRKIRNTLLEGVSTFMAKQIETLDIISNELEKEGIFVVRNATTQSAEFIAGKKIFDEEVLPKLPVAVNFDLTHILDLENHQLGLILGDLYFVAIPQTIARTFLAENKYIFFLDDLLLAHAGKIFAEDLKAGIVSITRDGDFRIDFEEEDSESIPDVIQNNIGRRERGKPTRMQTVGDISEQLLDQLIKKMRITERQIFIAPGSLCLFGLWSVTRLLTEQMGNQPGKLAYKALRSSIPPSLNSRENIFESLKTKDILLHHPYDSFDAFVNVIRAAKDDPLVESIEQTVYRMDVFSPVIDQLKEAAKTKKVRVFIELRARFDEAHNLKIADELRRAGAEVGFGFGKLKLHAKVAQITRVENGKKIYYSHLSTGNYNATTARQYEDLAILTANQELGQDIRYFLECLWNKTLPTQFKHLVAAPTRLHKKLTNLIELETKAAQQGKNAKIIAKVNALIDESIIVKLYDASKAGVQIDLIVRGACSLIPGVKGLSDRIRVISVVDRFLEHSRVYYFQSSNALFLSSADWMQRNFFSRLELAFPVLDPEIFKHIESEILPTYLSDSSKAKELTPQGSWKKRTSRFNIRSQTQFEINTLTRYT